ncbi:hypothetical protein [Mucilaginibacter polytrichastri]|uniref:Uncharacterized protein n=1 Tax=Mucilaginibacter polytrichastri TaxID=1302689 RepID=A0A1Q5ZXX4_9SPHI|nr:hypothetical protein [Mucilaginibacter polytrichastri]OKS86599.1 hypothetical protein RG47T_2055 [Mucilaginibacter polytrichastri]SFS80698.1 hypothetical protein SAMN04487890_104166 [Mucilaginibacter polytrichastri]
MNFNITSANITTTSPLTVDNATTVYTQPVVALIPNITLKSSPSGLLARTGGGTGILANIFSVKLIGTGGNLINVLGTAPSITLTSTAQSIYSTVLGALPGGALNFRYTLSGVNTNTWIAGSYTSELNFGITGISSGSVSPLQGSLNLNVAAFISAVPTPTSLAFTINSLDYYRASTISGTYSIATTTTVPYSIRLKNNAATFSYSNGYSGATDPATPTTLLTAQATAPATGTAITGGTSFTNLITGLAVPTANLQTNVITLSIKPTNLKTGFLQKGIYTTTVTFEIFDAQTTPTATTQTLTCPLTITVSDLSELKVNQADINLNYTGSADYTNGIYADASGHLTLSNTNPFDVYVKASSSTLSNGANTLPVSVITIAPMPAYPGSFTSVNLSATAQKILSGTVPAVDKILNVRYAIPAAKSPQLLGKPAGTYNTTVTYSFIAP